MEVFGPGRVGMVSRVHRALSGYLFYPLAVASLIAMAFYLGERGVNGWRGPRLHLNLFLAWLSYGFAVAAILLGGPRAPAIRRWASVACLVLWFFFFPNAPYLLTDFMYLGGGREDIWQRVGIFCAFAQCGMMLAVASLFLVQSYLRGMYGRFWSTAVVSLALCLSGAGIFVGRFLRWNSWDLLTRPLVVVEDTMTKLREPIQGIRPLAFSLMFTLIIAAVFYFVMAFRRAPDVLPGRDSSGGDSNRPGA